MQGFQDVIKDVESFLGNKTCAIFSMWPKELGATERPGLAVV